MQVAQTTTRALARWRDDWFPQWKVSLIVSAGLALAILFGIAVAEGGTRLDLAFVLAGTAALVPISHALLFRRIRHGFITVEVPLLLLLISNLVFRIRSAQDLAVDPLDSAAQFRVALVVLALGLGGIALISPSPPHSFTRVMAPPLVVYAIYVVVVCLGAPLSVDLPLTFYRGVELAAAVVVLAGARRGVGAEATPRIEALLYWFGVALLVSVWVGVVLFPDRALSQFQNGAVRWRFQVNGALPAISANSVGAISVMIAAWSLARVAAHRMRPRSGYLVAIFAVGTLVAAQYRTGYIALLLVIGVWLLLQHRWGLAGGVIAFAIAVVLLVPSVLTQAEPYVLRGQTTAEASGLSSRVDWWGAAIPVWRTSPWLGRGLLTGTRFEVLEPLGEDTTSSIHSTWIEALVGTGVIGVSLLIICLLMLFTRAVREARRPLGWKVPLLLLIVLTVRSFTGGTIESFDYFVVVFLWLASSVDEWQSMGSPIGSDAVAV